MDWLQERKVNTLSTRSHCSTLTDTFQAKREAKKAVKAEIASLRTQYNFSGVLPSQTNGIHSLRIELDSLRAAAEEEVEVLLLFHYFWVIQSPNTIIACKVANREQDVLKATIRGLRESHNLTHILPSVRNTVPALKAEHAALLEEIGMPCPRHDCE